MENTELPSELEIGMVCVTKTGEIVRIISHDMFNYPYECFERLATEAEKLNFFKSEKLITFKIISESGCWVVDQEATNLLQIVFGSNKDRKITAETIRSAFPDFEDDEELTFTLKVEKCYTQKDLDELPEFDGDMH